MADADEHDGPFVLNIRVSRRLLPFATVLLMLTLPLIGGGTPQAPTARVVLAGSSVDVQSAVQAVDVARREMSASTAARATGATAPTTPAPSAFSGAVGGGLFMFPAISLAPATAQAIAAPLLGRPMFIHPVAGGESSPFGPRIHPLLGRPMFHTGIDLSAACGTPIHAAADGTVVYARVSASWGGRTIIAHTPTLKTAYGHQSRFLVTEGQVVKQGQVIGLSGTTGWSTGCHLHFDVIVNDRYVDPAPYLGFPPSATASVPYAAVPHLVLDLGQRVIRTVEDGDVPLQDASDLPPTHAGGSSHPLTTSAPATTPATVPSSSPATSLPPTTPRPGTTTPTSSPGATTPTTTSAPPTSTTTSPPPPSTTTTVPPSTATSPPAATTTSPPATSTSVTAPTTTDPPTSSPSATSSSATSPSATSPTPVPTTCGTSTTASSEPPSAPACTSSQPPTTAAVDTAAATAAEVLQTVALLASAT